MIDQPWISVVIPAYNEATRLPGTLAQVLAHMRQDGRPFEVVVADDGSTDATADASAAAGPEVRVVRLPHTGKGAAVRAGVLASSGRLVLVTDADLSAPIGQLEALVSALDAGAGAAIGSRRAAGGRTGRPQPLRRRVMGAVFNGLVRALVLPGVRDTQCGFKLFRGDLGRRVFSLARVEGFAFDVEAILLVRHLGERVVEVPVAWWDSPHSRVRPLRDSAAMMVELLRIRLRTHPVPHPGEPGVVFRLALGAYLAAGAAFALGEHLIAGDAYSRIAIAHRMLFSGDPHLAAIGFVWSPLPVIALLPLVPLKWVVPAATDYGLVADVVSAACMAGAVREVCALLRDMGVQRAPRCALTAAFALHPLIVLYAVNGMSEAMFLLFLLAATRLFVAWLRTGDAAVGVNAGWALAAGFLTRYESLVASATVVGLAAVVSRFRGPGTARERRARAGADFLVVGMPVAMAFAVWTVASWAITGNPMEQLSSVYGNSSQLSVDVASLPGVLNVWPGLATIQLLMVEPFVAALVGLVLLRAARPGRRQAALAVVGVLGGVLAFMVLSSARGLIDHELRYMIIAVPLSVLAAGTLLIAPARRPRRPLASRSSRLIGIAAGAVTVLTVVAALPVSAIELTNPVLNPGDAFQVVALYDRHDAAERRVAARFVTERRIAEDLDAMRLPRGSVLLDDFLGFAIPLASRNPAQFVITSDRDFPQSVADPAGSGVRYLLVPEPVYLGRLDALNRRYPSLYQGGAGMATLVRTYLNAGDRSNWRLYRLNP